MSRITCQVCALLVVVFAVVLLMWAHGRHREFGHWAESIGAARWDCAPYAGCFAVMPDGTVKRRP